MVYIKCPFCGNEFDPQMGFFSRLLRYSFNYHEVRCPYCNMKMPGQD